ECRRAHDRRSRRRHLLRRALLQLSPLGTSRGDGLRPPRARDRAGARVGSELISALIGIEPLAAIPLCGSPWRQPRNPARAISPKALVVRAECLLERRFFVHHHKDMKKKPE